MSGRTGVRPDEGLMMMQELEDHLKEQMDKLEHVRLAALELKESLATSNSELNQSVSDHLDWLSHLTERVETLHLNTDVFVQMNPRARAWGGQQASKGSYRWAHRGGILAHDARSELGWLPSARRGSDAASDMSCTW